MRGFSAVTAVIFTPGPDGGWHTVRFAYDPGVVAVIKQTVPGYARSWKPQSHTWRVDPSWVPVLADMLRVLGHSVTGLDGRRHDDRARDRGDADWARALFRRVGPQRHATVYRALSRILHPDTDTGDTALQRELNAAHAELSTNRKESA
jgi:hypothetical protein